MLFGIHNGIYLSVLMSDEIAGCLMDSQGMLEMMYVNDGYKKQCKAAAT